ncbi:MFS transporter [uncultured Eudoraea sp.]|uniref:MFS transporter n=1 Tax=uncultured Eudoraea sp. TaxID=1035614 RepID=UPI00260C7AE9|nr:MFS transporter [uncultured Eudoraea sp.]
MQKTTKELIDGQALSKLQYTTFFVCFVMNILDGMDVMVISYCASAIATSWQVGPEELGIVFSSGLAGMMIGAMFLAPFADQIGRKRMILISAFLMGASVLMTAWSQTVTQLMFLRFLSGIGIGSMLASTASLTAEYAPDRKKDFWVSFVLSGYPVGAVLTGIVSANLVPVYGWPVMFKLAGLASFICLPLIFFLLGESVYYYLKRQPKGALQRVNTILGKMELGALERLPKLELKSSGIPVNKLLNKEFSMPTLQLWTALFMAFGCLYFLISWIPKLTEATGLSMSLAIYAGTVFNMGAFFGIITQGFISSRMGLKRTVALFLGITGILMATFKLFIGSGALLFVIGLLGFTLQGGFVGLYVVAARIYPTEFRTTGLGWAIGVGRLGGVIGPALGGILIGIGLSMAENFMIFSIPVILAGFITFYLASTKLS